MKQRLEEKQRSNKREGASVFPFQNFLVGFYSSFRISIFEFRIVSIPVVPDEPLGHIGQLAHLRLGDLPVV
jgi:hypothetical protein